MSLAALALTVVGYWPLVRHLNSTVLFEPNDASSTARDYWAARAQGSTPFTLTRDMLMQAPDGRPVSPAVQVANAFQPAFVLAVAPLLGYLGALNAFILAGVAASLISMYMLLRSQRIHPAAACAGSVAFASSQWTVEQLLYGHTAFAQMWVYPLLLGCLLWASRGTVKRAAAPGLVLAASFYTSSYLGLFSSSIAVIFIIVLLRARRRGAADLALRIGIAGGAAVVAALPVLLAPRITPSAGLGLPAYQKDQLVGAKLGDFFLPSAHHVLEGRLARLFDHVHQGENVLFYGFGTLLLGAVGVILILGRRVQMSDMSTFALFAVPVGWFLALPARPSIFGTTVALPDAANLIGGYVSWWRIYARFASVAGFGLVILASVALDRLLRSGKRFQLGVAVAGILLIGFESVPGVPIATARLRPDAVTSWLAAHPGGTVASYPMAPSGRNLELWDRTYWSFYYLQTRYKHPIFALPQNEPESTTTQIASYLAQEISNPSTPSILAAEGVRWVVVRDAIYAAAGEAKPRVSSGLRLVASLPGTRIFRVVAKPADLDQTIQSAEPALARSFSGGNPAVEFAGGFYGSERYNGYTDAHWLKQDGRLIVKTVTARPFVVYRMTLHAFAAATPRRLSLFEGSRRLAVFKVPTSDTTFQQDITFSRFVTALRLRVEPGPAILSTGDPRIVSVYVEGVSFDPISLKLTRGPAVRG